jgi:ketosteroid isomerase-like protein
MHLNRVVVIGLALAVAGFAVATVGRKGDAGASEPNAATATITEMENASVTADRAGDPSFIEKNYAENFSGGTSFGNWETKQSILADMKDSKNNKTNSEEISELNVRLYGDTAVATYKSTYDSIYHGGHRARTILTTDTFARQNGSWKQVASHSSELAK